MILVFFKCNDRVFKVLSRRGAASKTTYGTASFELFQMLAHVSIAMELS